MWHSNVLFAQIDNGLSTGLLLAGIVAVLAGVVILAIPRVLNYVVAIYLLASGALLIFEAF